MEESGLDVEAHDLIVVMVCIRDDDPHAGHFDNRSICFRKIYPLALAESLCHQPRLFFTAFDRSVRVVLVDKCPTDADGFAVFWYWCNAFKGASMFETVFFLLHRSYPDSFVGSCDSFII